MDVVRFVKSLLTEHAQNCTNFNAILDTRLT